MDVRLRAHYEDGFRYCSRCELWFMTNELRCPKCGRRLRCSPKKKKKKSAKSYLEGETGYGRPD